MMLRAMGAVMTTEWRGKKKKAGRTLKIPSLNLIYDP